MAKDLFRLRQIFQRTDGRCHICHCRLSFNNHGKKDAKGAWHNGFSIFREEAQHIGSTFPGLSLIEKAGKPKLQIAEWVLQQFS